jgi:hypothetical protein
VAAANVIVVGALPAPMVTVYQGEPFRVAHVHLPASSKGNGDARLGHWQSGAIAGHAQSPQNTTTVQPELSIAEIERTLRAIDVDRTGGSDGERAAAEYRIGCWPSMASRIRNTTAAST